MPFGLGALFGRVFSGGAAQDPAPARGSEGGVSGEGGEGKRGYKGFGSFHSEDVEKLVRLPDSKFVAPELPEGVRACLRRSLSEAALAALRRLQFGRAARAHFLVDFQRWTFVNHGAFGGALAIPFEMAQSWRRHCESQPLRFIDRELFPHTVHVLRQLAKLVNCRPQDVVFTQCATHALNAVVNSLPLAEDDTVYMLNIGYGSVKKMVSTACEKTGAKLVTGEVHFPLHNGPEDILQLVRDTLPPNCRLAVFDAVTSNTAVVLPLEELVALCRDRNVPVLVDGAHAMGSLPVNLEQLDADFYVANLHKWFCNPKGCAFLWANPKRLAAHVGAVKPLIISHGSGCGFLSDFIWDGCRDYSPVLTLGTTLRCWEAIGLDRARDYMHSTLTAAVAMLVDTWATSTLVPLDMCASMALVRLPRLECVTTSEPTSDDACAVQNLLYEAGIEVPVKCIQHTLYVRVSAHIYNEREDYRVLAAAVKGLAVA